MRWRYRRGEGVTGFIMWPNQTGRGCSLMQRGIPLVVCQVKVRTEIT